MTENPFDHERDQLLGALLREHFEPAGHDRFVQRVLASAQGRGAGPVFEVLSGWVRPGVAAAVLLLVSALVWLALTPDPAAVVTLDEVVMPGEAPAGLFSASQPDRDVILVSVLGEP